VIDARNKEVTFRDRKMRREKTRQEVKHELKEKI
jgi:hypothetical protein